MGVATWCPVVGARHGMVGRGCSRLECGAGCASMGDSHDTCGMGSWYGVGPGVVELEGSHRAVVALPSLLGWPIVGGVGHLWHTVG